MNGFRRFTYRTRGIYLLASLLLLIALKHFHGSSIGFRSYLFLLLIALGAQSFRTWAAGFVGTRARGEAPSAEILLTAGPYAHVRNPMYLGNLIIVVALALMSGVWFAPVIALSAWVFVYATVIPYEESFLRRRFQDEYEGYFRSVPRLLPSMQGYGAKRGFFRMREGLANEVVAWPTLVTVAVLFRVF